MDKKTADMFIKLAEITSQIEEQEYVRTELHKYMASLDLSGEAQQEG